MTFPQLTSGALVQYPLGRRSVKRTVMTTAGDGTVIKLADDAAASVEWTLRYDGLSSAEWQALEGCFESSEGQLTTFLFIDPLGNTLAWSTDLTNNVWQAGPGLSVTAGLADPFGGTQAYRFVNQAQAAQAVTQSVSAPGSYLYTLSVYASSPSPETITLLQQSGSAVNRVVCSVGPEWTRFTATAQLGSSSQLVIFGVELQPGATVVLAAPQAEPQPRAGAYAPTYEQSAVYPNTRFMEDGLETTLAAPEQYSCVVRLRSAGV